MMLFRRSSPCPTCRTLVRELEAARAEREQLIDRLMLLSGNPWRVPELPVSVPVDDPVDDEVLIHDAEMQEA